MKLLMPLIAAAALAAALSSQFAQALYNIGECIYRIGENIINGDFQAADTQPLHRVRPHI
jgi:hypothetical protein